MTLAVIHCPSWNLQLGILIWTWLFVNSTTAHKMNVKALAVQHGRDAYSMVAYSRAGVANITACY